MSEYPGDDQKECLEFAVSKHRRALLAAAYHLCRQVELARDAVQEAFLVLARRDCCAVENLRAFLATVVRRHVMRVVCDPRKAAPEESFPETLVDSAGANQTAAALERPALLALMRGLPEAQRELVRLVYFEGHKPGEAALRMNIKPAQAHQLHHTALKALRAELEKDRELFA